MVHFLPQKLIISSLFLYPILKKLSETTGTHVLYQIALHCSSKHSLQHTPTEITTTIPRSSQNLDWKIWYQTPKFSKFREIMDFLDIWGGGAKFIFWNLWQKCNQYSKPRKKLVKNSEKLNALQFGSLRHPLQHTPSGFCWWIRKTH